MSCRCCQSADSIEALKDGQTERQTDIETDADLDNCVLKGLFEVDKFASTGELHLVEGSVDVLDVFHQSSHDIIIMTQSRHQVLTLVRPLSQSEALLDNEVEDQLQPEDIINNTE